jgi:hypothetical protein
MHRTSLSLFLLGIGGLLTLSLPARAEDGIVAVGGEFLMRIRAGSTGMTAEQRAQAVTDRLTVILGDALIRPADVRPVTADKKTVKILVKNRLLVTVTPEDGKANGLSAMQQANVWVKQLRSVLPKINARPNPNEQNP